ncbi:MAG: hypothetical protein QXP27_09885 [Candidatus Methanomethyliaceae archaeon]
MLKDSADLPLCLYHRCQVAHQDKVRGSMTGSMFNEHVKRRFRYLIENYGFLVIDEKYDPEAFGNSLVDFQSDSIVMRVLLDRGQAMVDFRPRAEPSETWYGLDSVIEFLAPEADEPTYIFPETWDNYQDMIKWQVDRLANVVQRYCARVLRGEFSEWEEMAEARSRKAISEYRALTGRSPVRIASEELRKALQREEEKRSIKDPMDLEDKELL